MRENEDPPLIVPEKLRNMRKKQKLESNQIPSPLLIPRYLLAFLSSLLRTEDGQVPDGPLELPPPIPEYESDRVVNDLQDAKLIAEDIQAVKGGRFSSAERLCHAMAIKHIIPINSGCPLQFAHKAYCSKYNIMHPSSTEGTSIMSTCLNYKPVNITELPHSRHPEPLANGNIGFPFLFVDDHCTKIVFVLTPSTQTTGHSTSFH